MQLRYRFTTMLAAAGLLVAATAFAGKPTPVSEPIDSPIQRIGGEVLSPQSACVLGVTGAPASIINNWLEPPNDEYYTLIRPSDCPNCPAPRAIVPTIAHLLLNFRAVCPIVVEVAIVGATGSAACRTPDFTNTLCPPVTYTLTPPGPGNWNFPLPLPAGCCIASDAFLVFRFPAPLPTPCGNLSTTAPRLITTSGCQPCVSYNVFPGGPPGGLELCSVGFPGNPVMNLEAECCQVVPTLPGTWGRLKIRYTN